MSAHEDAIAAYVLAGRPWTREGLSDILTDPLFRSLTKSLKECKYLIEKHAGHPRGGHDWTPGGRKFLQKRLWQRPQQRGEE